MKEIHLTPKQDDLTDLRGTLFEALSVTPRAAYRLFRTLVNGLGLPRNARVLDVGCARLGGSTLGVLASEFSAGDVIGLDRRRDEVQSTASAAHVRTVAADITYWGDDPVDLICIDLGPAQIYQALSVLIETVPRLLKPGGFVLARLPTRAPDSARDLRAQARRAVREFLTENFASLEPDLPSFLRPLVDMGYQPVAVIPARFARPLSHFARRLFPKRARWRLDAPTDRLTPIWTCAKSAQSWLVLRWSAAPPRNRAAAPDRPGARYRAASASAFDLNAVVAWLAKVQAECCPFLQPEPYFARLDRKDEGAVSLLKHDIHHDLRRAVRMAEAEAARGISGVYFMMGPSDLNHAYFDLPYTWDALRYIRSLGHSLGLHLDVMATIERRGDLYRGITEMQQKFADEQIEIDTANCHGNTSYRSTGLNSIHFFKETAVPVEAGDPRFAPHVGRYSLAEISERFGIRYWLDSAPANAGRTIRGVTYVTDNSSALAIYAAGKPLISDKVRLGKEFKSDAEKIFSRDHTLTLLHPQFYE